MSRLPCTCQAGQPLCPGCATYHQAQERSRTRTGQYARELQDDPLVRYGGTMSREAIATELQRAIKRREHALKRYSVSKQEVKRWRGRLERVQRRVCDGQ